MVFRRDNKTDSFQRQMSAIREQIGPEDEPEVRSDRRDSRFAPERTTTQDRSVYAEPTTGAYGFSEFASTVAPQPAEILSMTPVAPTMPAIPIVDAQTAVISHDTTWKGEIQSNGTVHIHGRFEGAINARQDVYIAEEADVDATITATNVVIAGLAKGTVRCDARFEVLQTGRVSGEIMAPILVVHEGATVSGQLRMGTPEVTETKPTPVVQRRVTRGTA